MPHNNTTSTMFTGSYELTINSSMMTESDTLNSSATTNASANLDDHSDVMERTADVINLYIRPIILIIGFNNNMVTLFVMRRPRLKILSVSVYFSALAVSDTFVIIIDWVFNILRYLFGIYLRNDSTETCRQYHFWLPVFFTYSAWLVVCVAVERVIVVKYPFRAKSLCNVRNAWITVFALFIVIFGVSWYHYLIWAVDKEGICSFDPSYLYFSMYIAPWLMSVLYSYLPFIILMISNGILLSSLATADKKREIMTKNTESPKMADKFTVTSFAICMTYLVLTTPVSVYYTLIFANYTTKSPGFQLAGAITDTLGVVNYAINMFLYVVTSKLFRNELKSMFYCTECKKGQTNSGINYISEMSLK